MASLTPRERIGYSCGICGKDDRPLLHMNHDDYDGWLCGACLAERWPGLVARILPLKQFVEATKCSSTPVAKRRCSGSVTR